MKSVNTTPAAYTYRCGHLAQSAPPMGTQWLYDCDGCHAVKVDQAKERVGWIPGPVYTVIGECGNSDGPYTGELPSMAAALEAVRTVNLPLAPISTDGSLRDVGNRSTFTVTRALCYTIIEHEPQTATDPVTGWQFGGIYSGHRRVYRLADGSATIAGPQPVAVPEEEIPAEWVAYRAALAALPQRTNWITAYREALKE